MRKSVKKIIWVMLFQCRFDCYLVVEIWLFQRKKNGAARLDPWEIFLLLALKIPFHFISLRKLENYLQFYMTIAFKLNRTKIKVHHKFEIAFNFKKEIPLKCFLSPLGILYPLRGIVPFYIRNPFEIHFEQFGPNIEIAFNFKLVLGFG